MSKEELERLRTAYEFEVALYEGKGEVISFEQWLRNKGEDSLIISEDYPPSCEIKDISFVDADKVNTINMDKPSLNQIGTCTLKMP